MIQAAAVNQDTTAGKYLLLTADAKGIEKVRKIMTHCSDSQLCEGHVIDGIPIRDGRILVEDCLHRDICLVSPKKGMEEFFGRALQVLEGENLIEIVSN